MSKLLRISGLFLHCVYYVFFGLSFGNYEYSGQGVGKSFGFWIYAVLIVIPVLALYGINDIITLKNRKSISAFRRIMVVVAVLLYFLVGTSANIFCIIIWNVYFLGLFVMQIASFFSK